ncbi:MAG TPA: PrsW family glutamic-type intramembrane protease [Candidatus Paceibacterota bacterium]|jgi:RsiW-degrading membrane proteinase PrsW (M82 family)|nr:PrsW family glutamic-type intramembrane protease [Candidatus Paceibacterota bacterium]
MIELFKNSETLFFAILGGAVPAILWLWFWLREEDSDNTEPKGLIALSFILGGLIVIIAIWMEKYSLNFIKDNTIQVITWSAIEELLKFAGILIIITGSNIIKEPIDYPMYFISCALGFAALENILYLLHLLDINGTVVGMLTGNLRFLGSTLLHAISSGMIGSALGLSFYLKKYRAIYLLAGILCAITLHSIFNFLIIERSGENFLGVFGFLWVVAIINILIFEKLKRMGSNFHTISA